MSFYGMWERIQYNPANLNCQEKQKNVELACTE